MWLRPWPGLAPCTSFETTPGPSAGKVISIITHSRSVLKHPGVAAHYRPIRARTDLPRLEGYRRCQTVPDQGTRPHRRCVSADKSDPDANDGTLFFGAPAIPGSNRSPLSPTPAAYVSTCGRDYRLAVFRFAFRFAVGGFPGLRLLRLVCVKRNSSPFG